MRHREVWRDKTFPYRCAKECTNSLWSIFTNKKQYTNWTVALGPKLPHQEEVVSARSDKLWRGSFVVGTGLEQVINQLLDTLCSFELNNSCNQSMCPHLRSVRPNVQHGGLIVCRFLVQLHCGFTAKFFPLHGTWFETHGAISAISTAISD